MLKYRLLFVSFFLYVIFLVQFGKCEVHMLILTTCANVRLELET